jgi:hypothetical protein
LQINLITYELRNYHLRTIATDVSSSIHVVLTVILMCLPMSEGKKPYTQKERYAMATCVYCMTEIEIKEKNRKEQVKIDCTGLIFVLCVATLTILNTLSQLGRNYLIIYN